MRSSRKRNWRSWTPETSKAAHAAKRAKRMATPAGLPVVGHPVGVVRHTIRVEDHLDQTCLEIRLRQAPRANQVIAEVFGRKSKPHGLDYLLRHLRTRLLVRWLPKELVQV